MKQKLIHSCGFNYKMPDEILHHTRIARLRNKDIWVHNKYILIVFGR